MLPSVQIANYSKAGAARLLVAALSGHQNAAMRTFQPIRARKSRGALRQLSGATVAPARDLAAVAHYLKQR
jgi:hypothetical protein